MSSAQPAPTLGRMSPRVIAAALALSACAADDIDSVWSGDRDLAADPAPPGSLPLDELPRALADPGLCADASCAALSVGVAEFEPRWPLWSDGATKRRWIWLPPGTQIDNRDADYWQFPVGTKLWKEFTRDGVRVETRYMARWGTADDAWIFGAYEWDLAAKRAVLMKDGDTNVNGTAHDIPAAKACTGCHANVKSRVLGFGAFQLDYDAPEGHIDLADLAATDRLSAPPSSFPMLPLPGDATEQAALGYFHANCGHCHNSRSPLINRPSLRLESAHIATLAATKAYKTTVNVQGATFGGATVIAKPGDPDHSIIVTRMTAPDLKKRMPALGVEVVDPDGLALIRRWIKEL